MTSSNDSATVGQVQVPSAPEPERSRLFSVFLYLGIIAGALRALAYVMGTDEAKATGLPPVVGGAYQLLFVCVLINVLRWRRWAVLAWGMGIGLSVIWGAFSRDPAMLLAAAVQAGILFFLVRPIWSWFR